jgi:tetratricopeptide (TPR) repeat protein
MKNTGILPKVFRSCPAPASCFKLTLTLSIILTEASLSTSNLPVEGAQSEGLRIVSQPQGRTMIDCSASLIKQFEEALAERGAVRARQILPEVMQCRDLDPDFLLRTGSEFSQKEAYPEAIRVFGRCVQDYPQIFECHYNLALIEFGQHRLDEARAELKRAPRALARQELARCYLRGKIQEALNHPEEAERDLSAAFSGAPQQENYALDLGLFYIRVRAYVKASAVFETGTRYYPRSPFLLIGVALSQFMRGQVTQCEETCRQLLEIQPDFSAARMLMAFALYMGGQYAEAESTAAEGLRSGQPDPYLCYLHAAALLKLQSRDYDRMLRELSISSAGIPRCGLCYFAQSKVHEELNNSQAAVNDLNDALALNPGLSEAWYRLARLYERTGRPEDASRCYARFRESKAAKSNYEAELIRNFFVSK